MTLVRALRLVLIGVLAATLLSACSEGGTGQEAQGSPAQPPSKLAKVRVGYLPVSTTLPVWLAKSEGYFRDAGLDVRMERFANANLLLTALLTGQIDATAVCADEPILRATTERSPGTLFIYLQEILTEDRPFVSIVVRPDIGVHSVSDLTGKSLATFPGSQLRIYSQLILRHWGVDPASVNLVQLAPPNMLAALAAGTVDALLALEPVGTLAVSTGKGTIIEHSPIVKAMNNGKPMAAASYLLGGDWSRRHPDFARAFVESVYRAVDLIEEDYQRAAKLYPEFTPIPAEIAPKIVITEFARADAPDLAGLRLEAEVLVEHGVLDRVIDVETLIYRPVGAAP